MGEYPLINEVCIIMSLPKSLLPLPSTARRKRSLKERDKHNTFTTKDVLRKRKSTYRVMVVKEEDGSYSGRCIEYPGAISQGETLAELKENMKDAISLVRQSYEGEIVKIAREQAMKNNNNQLIEVTA